MAFDILPFPRSRDLLIDSFQMVAKRHIVHGFLEVDVTVSRHISNIYYKLGAKNRTQAISLGKELNLFV